MRRAKCLAPACCGLLAHGEVLDLGQLDQYKPRIQNSPQLGANSMWISGKEGDGFDIELSPDTRAKIQGVLDGCGVPDDHCYQEARNVLHSAELQIDGALERRGFAQLLSKTFKSSAGVLLTVTSILIAEWKLNALDTKQLGVFVPQQEAQKASALASATAVVISAQGSGIGTVTPTPDPTKLQGTQTPTATLVTQPSGGFAARDVALILDADLARRIDDLMHIMTNCDDGAKFDADTRSHTKHRSAGGTLGEAICAVEATIPAVAEGNMFNDVLLVARTRMPFTLAEGADKVVRAANVVIQFVLAYAPMLTLTPDEATQLGIYLFMLGYDAIVEDVPLTGQNRIAASLVATSPTTTTTSSPTQTGCLNPDTTPLLCGYPDEYKPDCDVQFPDKSAGPDAKTVCASGEHKGCECNAPPDVYMAGFTEDQAQAIIQLSDAMDKAAKAHREPPAAPECQPGKSSNIPSNVFGSDKNSVYGHFCDSWHAGNELKMTVDAAGNERKPPPRLRRRTPPPNPDAWSKYNFDLSFEPGTDKSKKCSLNCKDAFSAMTQACSNTGTVGNLMAQTGKIDVGCGTFAFSIVAPPAPVPLTQQDRHCFGANDFGKHGDVNGGTVGYYSGWSCAGTAIIPIKRLDPSTNIHFSTLDGGVPYQYNIYWKDGCVLDNGSDQMYPANPLNVKDPGASACQQLLIDDWKKCNNGGVGGSVQVGCLVYEFKAQKS